MAGGEIYRSGSPPAQNLEGDHRSRGITVTQIGFNPGTGKYAGSLLGKALAHEAGITPDDNTLVLLTAGREVVRNSLDNDLDVIKGEILAQNTPPAGCAECDTSHGNPPEHNRTAFVVLQ